MLLSCIFSTDTPPVTEQANMRKRICARITGSGFFRSLDLVSMSNRSIRRRRSLPRFSFIFHQMFSPILGDSFEYTNPYQQRNLRVNVNGFLRFKEYVFVCPMRNTQSNAVYGFYVSKEYNLSSGGESYKPGRFIVGDCTLRFPFPTISLILAEEPAKAYTEPDFNVELHYLRMRKYIQPGKLLFTIVLTSASWLVNYDFVLAENNDIDPLCRLISVGERNQHYRLCVAVSRSSYFKDIIEYPPKEFYPCELREISFRTAEAIREAGHRRYVERMTLCRSIYVDSDEGDSLIFISRAYISNQVFVYEFDSLDNEVYLENLSTNISIVDELNSFDLIED